VFLIYTHTYTDLSFVLALHLEPNHQPPGAISCRKGNPCTINFEDVQLTTAAPWQCGNAKINTRGAVSPSLPNPCAVGPDDDPTPPPAPVPRVACALSAVLGCFNDTAQTMVPYLPRYQPQLHDIVTQGNCAAACFGLKLKVAGIDAGNHCWCGSSVANATAQQRKRPMSECGMHCHGNASQACGGAQRMMAYSFDCEPEAGALGPLWPPAL
jgi:hypothetical protein